MNHIKPDTKLMIKSTSINLSDPEIKFFSHLESILPDGYILLTVPYYKGLYYQFELNEILSVFFNEKDGICDFRCVAEEQITKNNIRYIKARIISEINHTQRRDSFRVKLDIDGEITIECQIDGEIKQIRSKCRTFDISCDGAGLYIEKACDIGENVIVSLPIGENDQVMHLKAEVKWHKQIDGTVYTSGIGVKFCYRDKIEGEIVMKYVLKLQREILRKKRDKK